MTVGPPPPFLNPPTVILARMMWWRGTPVDEIAWLLSADPAAIGAALFARVPVPVMRPAT